MTILIIEENEHKVDEVSISGFKEGFGRNVGTYFLVNIYTLLWSLLFVIPGIIKTHAYSMAFYLRNKEPDLSSNDVITKSKELMKRHKGSLFVLDLTYIGWYLLSALTFGILLLWAVSRHYTVRTLLFNEVYHKQPKIKK